jgi:hypothetical protein
MQPVLLQIQILGSNAAAKPTIGWSQLRLNEPKINWESKVIFTTNLTSWRLVESGGRTVTASFFKAGSGNLSFQDGAGNRVDVYGIGAGLTPNPRISLSMEGPALSAIGGSAIFPAYSSPVFLGPAGIGNVTPDRLFSGWLTTFRIGTAMNTSNVLIFGNSPLLANNRQQEEACTREIKAIIIKIRCKFHRHYC